LVLIAFGVVLSTNFKSISSSLGTVLIALGGFFLIVGMSRKKEEE